MRADFRCSVCGAGAPIVLGRRRYTRADIDAASAYKAKRLRILFDLWFDGADVVDLKAVMCGRCGLVCHLPRVETSDVESKYRVLASLGNDYGDSETEVTASKRSNALYAAVERALAGKSAARILDFGGGDGRLMQAFTASGHRTFLVDYNDRPSRWVSKLADSIELVPARVQFDLIVANHVLEHVAEPTDVVRQLATRLSAGGWLFVEVPVEVWGRPPLPQEPVTHVNFFVRGSISRVLEEAGLAVVSSRLARSLHPSGGFTLTARVLGRVAGKAVPPVSSGCEEVMRYLSPSLLQRFRRRVVLSGGAMAYSLNAAKRGLSLAGRSPRAD